MTVPAFSVSQEKLPQTRPEFIALFREQIKEIQMLKEQVEIQKKQVERLKREHQLLYHLCRKNKVTIPEQISRPEIEENKNFKDSMLLGDIGYIDNIQLEHVIKHGAIARIQQPDRYKHISGELWVPDTYKYKYVFVPAIDSVANSYLAEIKMSTYCIIAGFFNSGKETLFQIEIYAG